MAEAHNHNESNTSPSAQNINIPPLQAGAATLRSQFGDDPEMRELVELFVSELPVRTQAISEAVNGHQWEQVKRLSHQLKGSSAGYGFPTIGVAAGNVEHLLVSGSLSDQKQLDVLKTNVNELIGLCLRATA